ncbi:hypothetical protein BESB_036740 [Besnoitia besnoiti]|uniref:Uncharacterized protein n=1 Tax=Besnoitia besnoiti TaxID=94643 RepID=A0A2A9MMA2_BESBE|nr:hypothetical protein BESB_036740 [Besnoitia besnoiti]PFH37216.1 hypothetical protein BESB_036740 [Besnoitia besnoiti]
MLHDAETEAQQADERGATGARREVAAKNLAPLFLDRLDRQSKVPPSELRNCDTAAKKAEKILARASTRQHARARRLEPRRKRIKGGRDGGGRGTLLGCRRAYKSSVQSLSARARRHEGEAACTRMRPRPLVVLSAGAGIARGAPDISRGDRSDEGTWRLHARQVPVGRRAERCARPKARLAEAESASRRVSRGNAASPPTATARQSASPSASFSQIRGPQASRAAATRLRKTTGSASSSGCWCTRHCTAIRQKNLPKKRRSSRAPREKKDRPCARCEDPETKEARAARAERGFRKPRQTSAACLRCPSRGRRAAAERRESSEKQSRGLEEDRAGRSREAFGAKLTQQERIVEKASGKEAVVPAVQRVQEETNDVCSDFRRACFGRRHLHTAGCVCVFLKARGICHLTPALPADEEI